MVILLYGPDTYSKFQKLRELRDSILGRNPLITEGSFDAGEEAQLYALHEFTTVTSLFSQGKRIAAVRNAISFLDTEVLQSVISRASKSSDVVLLLHEDREKRLEKKHEQFCKKHSVQVQFFAKPTQAIFRKKIREYAQKSGLEVDDRAISFLIEIHGVDLHAIISDIDKWSLVTKKIDAPFLSKTGEYVLEAGVFDFSQSILYHASLSEQLSLFERILSQRTDLYAIFNIVAKMTTSKDLIEILADADLKIKRGLLDVEQALMGMVLG